MSGVTQYFRGNMRNGKVELVEGVKLPEGAEVTVIVLASGGDLPGHRELTSSEFKPEKDSSQSKSS